MKKNASESNEIHKLFKYRVVNKNLIDSIVNGYLYCATPQALNDPFDCQIDIIDALNRSIKNSAGLVHANLTELKKHHSTMLERIKKDFETVGICSFSTDLLNPALWSYYSDEYEGVCLLYEFPSDFINDPINKCIGTASVTYGDSALTYCLLEFFEKYPPIKFNDFVIDLIKRILTIKGEGWKYEGEVRIIRKKPGKIIIDKSFLSQVCFGLRTPERDKELLKKILSDTGYNPKFCELRKDPHSDLGLTAVDI